MYSGMDLQQQPDPIEWFSFSCIKCNWSASIPARIFDAVHLPLPSPPPPPEAQHPFCYSEQFELSTEAHDTEAHDRKHENVLSTGF